MLKPFPDERSGMFRKFSALLDVFALIVSPAAGFDSYWHAQCSQKVGEQFGFTQDAWKATRQLLAGFFGPVSEHVSKKIQGKELEALNQFQANSPPDSRCGDIPALRQPQQRFSEQCEFRLRFQSLAAKHAEPNIAGHCAVRFLNADLIQLAARRARSCHPKSSV